VNALVELFEVATAMTDHRLAKRAEGFLADLNGTGMKSFGME
jgi:hypothetical protein